ncbi:MAG: YARHG domain-containing protein [Hungatella sp.]
MILPETWEALRFAKNEIYARHGRRFHDSELQGYFDQLSWY